MSYHGKLSYSLSIQNLETRNCGSHLIRDLKQTLEAVRWRRRWPHGSGLRPPPLGAKLGYLSWRGSGDELRLFHLHFKWSNLTLFVNLTSIINGNILKSLRPSSYLRCQLHSVSPDVFVSPWICLVVVRNVPVLVSSSPEISQRFRHSDDPWWHSILFLDLQSLVWRSMVLKLWLLSLGSNRELRHSTIELEEGKQNLIKNRLCLSIHLSGIFQSLRDKSEEQNSILYKRVLAV